MDQLYPSLACPICSKLLYAPPIPTDRLWECARCGRRILVDRCAHQALSLATGGGVPVEGVIWKDVVVNNFLALFFFAFFSLLWVLRIVNWLALGISVIMIVALGGLLLEVLKNRGQGITHFWLIPLIGLASLVPWGLLFLIPHIEPTIKRMLPNQFVSAIFLLVSGRGIVFTEGAAPLLLPVSSIVGWSYETGNALFTIDYLTADDKVASANFHGTEYGGVYDILVAKFGDRNRN